MTEVISPPTGLGPDAWAEGGADDGVEPVAREREGGRHGGGRRRLDRLAQPGPLITLAVVVACTVFVFVQLQPSQIFKNSTPAGGDMGAHVWLPAYIKRELLPHFRIFGWTMDWYAGFPALTYYFPLPMVAIAVISYVIPYNIAFKLVAVCGLVALPAACWALGRLARMRFPGPACLAVAAVPFLFGREFTIYGGNIASTMAGEFSFSVSLAFAVLFIGLVARGVDTGRHRLLAAVVLAGCGMSHILPLFFAVGGALVLTLMRRRPGLWWYTLPVLVVGGLLISFWALPFEYRLPYATNMGYVKISTYLDNLFPRGDTWLFILAGVGGVLALARRNLVGTFLLLMALLAAVVFRFAPEGRLWNARVLPFWFLCLYLLVGVAFSETGTFVAERLRGRSPATEWLLVPVPVLTVLVALVWVGFPLRLLPLGHVTASGRYDWLGVTSNDNSYVPDWITWNFSGYESAGKSSRTAYFALIAEMKKLGQTPGDGCGRAMYEYEPAINDMGTPDALMLLPYWTNGCIGSMEGLYYESSATTPYHFLNVSELSAQPSNPMSGLDYAGTPNVAQGVKHLQMFGVKYFMAVSPVVQAQAATDQSLQYLASVGPYPTDVTNAKNQNVVQNQTWKIYRILDSPLVQPLANQPVVMTGVSAGGAKWLQASEAWYLDPSRWNVEEAASGPASWARVSATATTLPVRPEPPTAVTQIHQGEESISFDVDRIGTPILVKTSYFPNWDVHGAKGVYWATPNLMVVIPTSLHVTLTYGYTPVDWVGLLMSLAGVAGAVVLWRRRRVSLESFATTSWAGGDHYGGARSGGPSPLGAAPAVVPAGVPELGEDPRPADADDTQTIGAPVSHDALVPPEPPSPLSPPSSSPPAPSSPT